MNKITSKTQTQLDSAITATFNAVNAADTARSSFQDLGGLFKAICKLTDQYSDAHNLARIGRYLTEDWSNMNDLNSEALNQCLNELRAVKEESEQKAA